MKTLFAFLLLFTLSACSLEPDFELITQQQLLANANAGTPQLILDVRSAEEYAEGHVPNAINISHEEIAANLKQIQMMSKDQSIPVVVYCRSGHRAGIALQTLKDNGFKNIKHLEGDMNGWRKAKLDVEK